MSAVLGLIQELADYEKEPDAVLVTADDLVRDGFGSNHYFMFCGGSRIRDCRHCIVLLSLLHLEGKNNPSGRFSSKTKMRGTGLCFIF
jgi:hypothetical protein